MSGRKYPGILIPLHLAEKLVADYSKAEADEYRNVIIAAIDQRIEHLFDWFGVEPDESPDVLLRRLGIYVAQSLPTQQFSQETATGRHLTEPGAALAADMGFLVAKFLLKEADGKLSWTTIRKPKSYVSYNYPVLVGFTINVPLDPTLGSMGAAEGILSGKKTAEVWLNMFNYWKQQIPQ